MMCADASAYNQDISPWSTSMVVDTAHMFEGATYFPSTETFHPCLNEYILVSNQGELGEGSRLPAITS